jgi:glutamyl-tRNA reductase
MLLLVVGCSLRNTPIGVRERLAFDGPRLQRALQELNARHGCEAVILSTCNRVEVYVAPPASSSDVDAGRIAQVLSEVHGLPAEEIRPHLYEHRGPAAAAHLFRVASSLDSLIIGEGEITGQVREAYEEAQAQQSVGPLLNTLFQYALRVAKRVRTETDIAGGKVSVSSAAVDYVREVFDHFSDKTILVIGAGTMGELTLKHLGKLQPRHILITNRNPEKALVLAQSHGGKAVPWEKLDDVLVKADIVVSATGAPEPIVTCERYQRIAARRTSGPVVILDIAVPRDFDPRIHDGDQTFLFNVDDLMAVRERTLTLRRQHIGAAEHIVEQETQGFVKAWARRHNGPVIEQLTRWCEARRSEVVKNLFSRLGDKLTEADREYIEKAFSLLQNQFLHNPITALAEETRTEPGSGGHTLRDALRKLFRLQDGSASCSHARVDPATSTAAAYQPHLPKTLSAVTPGG